MTVFLAPFSVSSSLCLWLVVGWMDGQFSTSLFLIKIGCGVGWRKSTLCPAYLFNSIAYLFNSVGCGFVGVVRDR